MAEDQSDYNILDEYIRAYGINIVDNTWQVLEYHATIFRNTYYEKNKREQGNG